jgi:O-acetyl-ADP-ribose deacetylase (regulator of RNase III)
VQPIIAGCQNCLISVHLVNVFLFLPILFSDNKFNQTMNSGARISVIEGDITTVCVDAIVNAANPTLLGGGGVDGAIHRAAGPKLREECSTLGGCLTGQAKITRGYRLPARWVIHTVGPIWHDGTIGEDEYLAQCYHNALHLASIHKISTIAFPSISTGAYGFPIDRASRIAIKEIATYLSSHLEIRKVILVCFSHEDSEVYGAALKEVLS